MIFVKQLVRVGALIAISAGALVGCGGAPSQGDAGSVVSTIEFGSNSNSLLALQGQGGTELTTVTFNVVDANGDPLNGVAVEFELSSDVGGIGFQAAPSATSDFEGQVTTVVQSGNLPASVFVSATIIGTSKTAFSDEIQVSTGTFIADKFPIAVTLADDVLRDPDTGLFLFESAGQVIGRDFGMGILASDQFGHKVRDGSRITFVSPQAGLVEPSTCETVGGDCDIVWTSAGNISVGQIVTVLAYASGAEQFDDANFNNRYDVGETFEDLGEPFADYNANGMRDDGEFYLDVNGNETYDSLGNGVWDGPCLETGACLGQQSTFIWDQVRFVLGACPTNEETGEIECSAN